MLYEYRDDLHRRKGEKARLSFPQAVYHPEDSKTRGRNVPAFFVFSRFQVLCNNFIYPYLMNAVVFTEVINRSNKYQLHIRCGKDTACFGRKSMSWAYL